MLLVGKMVLGTHPSGQKLHTSCNMGKKEHQHRIWASLILVFNYKQRQNLFLLAYGEYSHLSQCYHVIAPGCLTVLVCPQSELLLNQNRVVPKNIIGRFWVNFLFYPKSHNWDVTELKLMNQISNSNLMIIMHKSWLSVSMNQFYAGAFLLPSLIHCN